LYVLSNEIIQLPRTWMNVTATTLLKFLEELTLSDSVSDLVRNYDFPIPDAFLEL
jgi:hypothetical protein